MKNYNLKRINADGLVVDKIYTFQLPSNSTVFDLKTAYAEKRSIYNNPDQLRLTFRPDSADKEDPGNQIITVFPFLTYIL